MKRSRFTETQIISILKEADAGAKVKDICWSCFLRYLPFSCTHWIDVDKICI